MEKQEIIDHYKNLHDTLSNQYYKEKSISKEGFDAQHGQIWADMEAQLIVEGYKKPPEKPIADKVKFLEDRIKVLEAKETHSV